MRGFGLPLLFGLAACQAEPSGNATSAEVNNTLTEPAAEKGWQYSNAVDRVRSTSRPSATLLSSAEGDQMGRRAELRVAILLDGFLSVSFSEESLDCLTPCNIAYRSGGEVGSWTGASEAMGYADLNHSNQALAVIQRGGPLIVELGGRQYTFNTAGLEWPPRQPDAGQEANAQTPAPG